MWRKIILGLADCPGRATTTICGAASFFHNCVLLHRSRTTGEGRFETKKKEPAVVSSGLTVGRV